MKSTSVEHEIALRATIERYCREQSDTAFRAVYDACKQGVFRLAVHLCGRGDAAKDLSQEIWVKLWKHLCGFRGESKLSSWIYRVGMTTFLDRKQSLVGGTESKRNAITQEISALEILSNTSNDEETIAPPNNHNPQLAAERTSAHILVERALERLSAGERTVFVAKHFHDLTFKEIAHELGTHEGTAKTLHFRALKKLQLILAPLQTELTGDSSTSISTAQ